LTSDSTERGNVIALAKSEFRFLEGVVGRGVEVEDEAWRSVLAYVLGAITVEVELDWREKRVFVLVCRTVDGGRPPGYYRYDGRLMRVSLFDALNSGGSEHDKAIARRVWNAARISGPDAMTAKVIQLSAILREIDDRIGNYSHLFSD